MYRIKRAVIPTMFTWMDVHVVKAENLQRVPVQIRMVLTNK